MASAAGEKPRALVLSAEDKQIVIQRLARAVLRFQEAFLSRDSSPAGLLCQASARTRKPGALLAVSQRPPSGVRRSWTRRDNISGVISVHSHRHTSDPAGNPLDTAPAPLCAGLAARGR